MSRRKKGQNRKAERREKRKKWEINQEVAELGKTKNIDQGVAIIHEKPDYDDEQKENFLFSFIHYKPGQCGLSNLCDASAKQLVKKLRIINETTLRGLADSKLIKDNINNSGDYAKLYTGLSPDIDIKEICFSDRGRIFAYFVKRYVCIVAIDPNHINTR